MQWDKMKLRFPAHIGDIVHKVALARWSRTFAGTISSGVPMLQAIKIAGQTAGNAVVEEAMDDVYNSVKSRRLDRQAAPGERRVPRDGLPHGRRRRGLGSARDDAREGRGLLRDRGRREGQGSHFADRAVDDLLVGGGVGFIVIAMYLPIFSLYDNIR